MTGDFVYEPLNSTQRNIRLLRVLAGQKGDTLRCMLWDVVLPAPSDNATKAPAYEAISYVWGLVVGSEQIIINNRKATVTAAATQVLRRFREPSRDKVIWIDSICINQNDKKEKGHQVSLMSDVYRNSTAVIIWLGPEEHSTSQAYTSLHSIYQQLCEETDNGKRLREVLYGKSQSFQYAKTRLPGDCDFDALRRLFSRPWFQRRWVIQEAVLPGSGTFYCGQQESDMLTLFRCAVWMQHKQHQLPFDLDKEHGMLNASYMSAYADHDQGWFSAKYGQTSKLADLFRYFRTFDVTNPRDRVFSLLGMTRWHFDENPFPALVTPDYDKSEIAILRDATKMAIVETSDLWVLRYVDHKDEYKSAPRPAGTENLPSWVPALFSLPDFTKEPNPLRSTFSACHGLDTAESSLGPAVELDADAASPEVISVTGVCIETVDGISDVLSTQLEDLDCMAAMLRLHLHARLLTNTSPTSRIPDTITPQDIGMILCGGSRFDAQSSAPGTEPENIFEPFIDTIVAARTLEQVKDVLQADKSAGRCLWAIRFASVNRRLFRTDSGHVGLGPKSMRAGDCLAILAASRMPIILRPLSSGEYAVLGPCYAHGFMQGEVVSWMQSTGAVLRRFNLR